MAFQKGHKKLSFSTIKVKVKDLKLLNFNPRTITEEKLKELSKSLDKFDLVEIPVINTDYTIIAGNQRIIALRISGKDNIDIDVRIPNRKLTDLELKQYCLISNSHSGKFDFDIIKNEFSEVNFEDIGFDMEYSKYDKKAIYEPITEKIKPFNTSHILISYMPQYHDIIIKLISELNKDIFEIEISSN